MKWYFQLLIGIIIVSAIVGLAYREKLMREYPIYVRHYQGIMRKVSSEKYIEKLQSFTGYGGENQPDMHWSYILKFLGLNIEYTIEPIIRHEDPIEILKYGMGRCGEFVIAYYALAVANGHRTRIILDTNDHMWVEVWTIPPSDAPQMGRWDTVPFQWMHIEVTDGATWCKNHPDENPIDCPKINDSEMYERGGKELTEVWAIEPYFAQRVEDNYQYVE